MRQMGGDIPQPSLFIGLSLVQLLTKEVSLQPQDQQNRRRMEYAGDILEASGGACQGRLGRKGRKWEH